MRTRKKAQVRRSNVWRSDQPMKLRRDGQSNSGCQIGTKRRTIKPPKPVSAILVSGSIGITAINFQDISLIKIPFNDAAIFPATIVWVWGFRQKLRKG